MTGSPFFLLFLFVAFLLSPFFPNSISEVISVVPAHYYYSANDCFDQDVLMGYYGLTESRLDPVMFDGDDSAILTKNWDYIDNQDGFVRLKQQTKDVHGCDVFTFELNADMKNKPIDNELYLHKVSFNDSNGNIVDFYLYGSQTTDKAILSRSFHNYLNCYNKLYFEECYVCSYTCKTEYGKKDGLWEPYLEENGLYKHRRCIYQATEVRKSPEVTFQYVCMPTNWEHQYDPGEIDQTQVFVYYVSGLTGERNIIDAIRVHFGLEQQNGCISAKVISEEHILVSELNMLK